MSDQHGSHPLLVQRSPPDQCFLTPLSLSPKPRLLPSSCPWCFNPSHGNNCAYKNKRKRCFDIANHPVPQEKKKKRKYQQKHHDQSSHQDNGRLPCLKVRFVLHLEVAYPQALIGPSKALPPLPTRDFPCVTAPCRTGLSILVWQWAGEDKALSSRCY